MPSKKRNTILELFKVMEQFFEHFTRKCRTPSHYPALEEELERFRKLFNNNKIMDDIFDCFCKEMIDKSSLIRLENHRTNYYFFGDIHGSLSDLILLRNIFWKDAQLLADNHFIFMGDYVDRGIHGFEVAIYLLLLKIVFTDSFTLLRGNHEFPDMNSYSFLPELQLKFGNKHGRHIWTKINECFSMLPYAALICNNIFTAHGGFPKHLRSMQQIERIPKLLTALEEGSIEFQLVWNDFFSDSLSYEGRKSKYFAHNYARGAGYIIGKRAVERFLTRFHLSYIVRAHDFTVCERTGYDHIEVNNGAVFSLFTNSSYAGSINNTAYLFVSVKNELVEIFPLVQMEFADEFFNQSELIESNQGLAELKFKDPYCEELLDNVPRKRRRKRKFRD